MNKNISFEFIYRGGFGVFFLLVLESFFPFPESKTLYSALVVMPETTRT
jgi:hypothetical protein